MAVIPLGYAEGDASLEDLARIRLRNMYLTENRYSPDKLARLTRPSLTQHLTLPSSAVYGIWRQDGSIGDAWLVVSGEKLYKVVGTTVTELGPLPGTDTCIFAGTEDRVLIVRNSVAYSTDGTTITTIAMPDGKPVGSVATIDGNFLLSVEGAQQFYWIWPGETDPDPLNFASGERTPDAIVALAVVSDEIWLIGASGTEVWQTTGDLNAPYIRVAGRVYSDGCADPATVATTSYNGLPCLLWVTNKKGVMIAQGNPQRISTKSVESQLSSATNIRGWAFRYNLHDFYVVTHDAGTLVYDMTSQVWSTWDTYGFPFWSAHLGIQVNEDVYAGDATQGIIWKLTAGYQDDPDLPIVREVSGFVGLTTNGYTCDSVNVRMNSGWPPSYTGPVPVLELRWSDDYGFSWSPYFQAPMGQKGQYEYDVTFRSLGSMQRPGREFEFRFSEKATFRIDYATMNEV